MITEKYKERNVNFRELFESKGWRIKLYIVSYSQMLVDESFIIAGKDLITLHLPKHNSQNYGCGFSVIHFGKNSDLIFFSWWENENELFSKVFVSNRNSTGFIEKTSSGLVGCVWDLIVIHHERNAWVRQVLSKNPPNLNLYYQDILKSGRI